jgi:hypothetical protein
MAHGEMAIACVRYLACCFSNYTIPHGFPETKSWTSDEFELYVRYLGRWPLAHYALENLEAHLAGSGGGQNELVIALVERLTDHPCFSFLANWIVARLQLNPFIHTQHEADRSILRGISRATYTCSRSGIAMEDRQGAADEFKYEALHAAAKLGLSHVARVLLITCTPVGTHVQGQTPLVVSAGKARGETVKLLRNLGMSVKDTNNPEPTLAEVMRTSLYLLVCINTRRGHSRLIQIPVAPTTPDGFVFQELRSQYFRARGWRRSILTLLEVRSLELVKVGEHRPTLLYQEGTVYQVGRVY